MKKGWKIFLALFLAVAINVIIIAVFILWCKQIEKQSTTATVTNTEITAPLTPGE